MTDLYQRCQPIRLVLCDVDGVLTDGGIYYDDGGGETKRFHVRDGLGIRLWQRAGGHFGLVTKRNSPVVARRAEELGITIVVQHAVDKLAAVKRVTADLGIRLDETCYVGDDLPDLAVLRAVGLPVAVGDACDEVLAAAHLVTRPGGTGAVREVVETILKNQGRWSRVFMEECGGLPPGPPAGGPR